MVDIAAGPAQNSGSIPLNWSMLQILSILLEVIDQRHGMLGFPNEDGLVTAPCPACSGLGHTLVVDPYSDAAISESVADDDTALPAPDALSTTANVAPASTAPLVNTGSTQAPAPAALNPAPAAVGVNAGAIQAPAPAALNPAPAAVGVNAGAIQAPTPALNSATVFIAGATQAVTPAPVPVAGGTQATPPALNPVIAPAPVGVVNAGGTQAAVPAPIQALAPIQTGTAAAGIQAADPQPIAMPLPGIHSIAGTSPPAPDQAIFTNTNAERFYVVSKGRRVGIFGGWVNTSPYVTGVGGAVYIRFSTMDAAVESYTRAFNAGLVSYL
ncbi:hypothetical protein EST38_g10272 [Candolleomyces aberdarensis]|uniref:Ribonuclease H1 N-terminal domain-containing protein n=1 Tax=Candolleomyces aberdarensis TaxID=2316362 RepID=A0A4Q2D7T2_9AGAR|nr:hypothetical protein EST38_g10272 [Candolleomyces aberdarensis]